MAAPPKDSADPYLYEARMKILGDVQAQNTKILDLIEQCHAKVALVEQTKQELHAQYNAIAPISRLPAEVLAAVFEICASIFKITPKSSTSEYVGTANPPRWLRILHVCREWRRVALSTPRLWTCIWPVHSDYIRFALAHSGRLPLDIPLWSLGSCKRVALHAVYPPILRELSRICIAHFGVNQTLCEFLSSLENSLDLEAPMLRELDITMRCFKAHIPVLSKLGMSQLAALTLREGSSTLLHTLIRPNLTILDVDFMPSAQPRALPDLLQGLPLLQRLVLKGLSSDALSLPDSPNSSRPPWHRQIDLPHLKHLRFEAKSPSLEAAQLLDCLTFPVDAAIRFCSDTTTSTDLFTEQYPHLLPLILSKIQVSDPLSPSTKFRPRAIAIRDFLDLELWSAPRPEGVDGHVVSPTVVVRRLELVIRTYTSSSLLMLFGLLDLTEVVALDFNHWERTNKHIWPRIFKKHAWPRLEKLQLPYDKAAMVLSTLATLHPLLTGNFLIPTLNTVELQDYASCDHPHVGLQSRCPTHLQILASLKARADGGQRLEHLVLSGVKPSASDADIAALRNVCGTLEIRYAEIHAARPVTDTDEDTDENDQEGDEDMDEHDQRGDEANDEHDQEGDGEGREYWDEGEPWDFIDTDTDEEEDE